MRSLARKHYAARAAGRRRRGSGAGARPKAPRAYFRNARRYFQQVINPCISGEFPRSIGKIPQI